MDPQLSGFAIAWWKTRNKLRRLESALPDPSRLEERSANLEQISDYSASKLDRLVESQDALIRRLANPEVSARLPESR